MAAGVARSREITAQDEPLRTGNGPLHQTTLHMEGAKRSYKAGKPPPMAHTLEAVELVHPDGNASMLRWAAFTEQVVDVKITLHIKVR